MRQRIQKTTNSCKRILRTTIKWSVGSLLVAVSLLQVHLALADLNNTENVNDFSTIHISTADKRYSLTAYQATFSDILYELGKAAGFKLKLFAVMEDKQQDWSFDSMPLPRLLDNILRGYSTVMVYEETTNKKADSNDRVLKELWLIAQAEDSGSNQDSQINLEIQLEQTGADSAEQQNLTPEQQYEITYIDNLEGMTGDDVIGILQQTLLTENDPLVRKRAVTALSDIGGTRVLDALESGMGDKSAEVRTELAKSFSGIKDQRSMLLLGQMLMGDHNAAVREQAVSSLYQQNTLAAHTFIEAALKDKDDGVKKTASEILQLWHPEPDYYQVE